MVQAQSAKGMAQSAKNKNSGQEQTEEPRGETSHGSAAAAMFAHSPARSGYLIDRADRGWSDGLSGEILPNTLEVTEHFR